MSFKIQDAMFQETSCARLFPWPKRGRGLAASQWAKATARTRARARHPTKRARQPAPLPLRVECAMGQSHGQRQRRISVTSDASKDVMLVPKPGEKPVKRPAQSTLRELQKWPQGPKIREIWVCPFGGDAPLPPPKKKIRGFLPFGFPANKAKSKNRDLASSNPSPPSPPSTPSP